MIATYDRIVVSVDMAQKDTMKVGDLVVKTAQAFDKNYRERSPVVARVEQGNGILKEGNILICHHNSYYSPSPYYLYDNLFSIPFNKTIFAILNEDGSLTPVCGNILGKKVPVETAFDLPPDQRTYHKNQFKVTLPGTSKYKPGQILFTRPSAPYEIVYNVGSIVHRIMKVSEDMVVGYVK